MYLSKLKTYLIFYAISFVILFLFGFLNGFQEIPFILILEISLLHAFLSSFFLSIFFYFFGLHKPLIDYFDKKYWEKEDEKNFQTNLRRTIQEKSALSQIDNNNFAFQNELLHDLEIKRILITAQIETEKIILENNLKKEFLTYEKYSEIFFGLLGNKLGLNHSMNVEAYVREAYEQMGLKIGYSPYGDKE